MGAIGQGGGTVQSVGSARPWTHTNKNISIVLCMLLLGSLLCKLRFIRPSF